jgi:tRNA (cmo5U34)-methyltransferase
LAASAAANQGLQSPQQTVGALPNCCIRTGADGDIPVDAGAAAEAIVGGSISQVHLLHIGAGGEVLHPFHHLHHAGAALAQPAAVVEVVQTLVGVDAGIEGSFAQVGTLDASDLLAFLFETDGGHGRSGGERAAKLRPTRGHLPSITSSCCEAVQHPAPRSEHPADQRPSGEQDDFDLVAQQVIPGYASLARLGVALLAASNRASRPGAAVLVAGCGTGAELVEARAQRPDWQITALDPSASMLAAAQARVGPAAAEAIRWQQARVEELNGQEAFAGALSVLVLQSLPDDGTKLKFLSALARSLEPGGQLLLVDLMAPERSPLQPQVQQAWLGFQRASGLGENDAQIAAHTHGLHPIGLARLTALVNAAGFGDPARVYQALDVEGFLIQRAP